MQKFRKERGISKADLALSCGTEISQISRLERGLLKTGISNIPQITKCLDILIKELFNFEY